MLFKRLVRIVHSKDPIPHFPIHGNSLAFNHVAVDLNHYSHFGKEVWMNVDVPTWVNCIFNENFEQTNCANTVGILQVNIQSHVSYWNALSVSVCNVNVSESAISNMTYLPNYIVNQWYL